MTRWFDAERHQRRSIRLCGHDYAQPGAYFITICTQGRLRVLGEIMHQRMHVNAAGLAAQAAWAEIPSHFPGVRLDAFVVMPNHVHGIIFIVPTSSDRAPGCDRAPGPVGATHASPLPRPLTTRRPSTTPNPSTTPSPRRPIGPPRCSVGAIVGSYKSAVTRRVNRLHGTQSGVLWQRNYYEHIVRDRAALQQIRRYIHSNPRNWEARR